MGRAKQLQAQAAVEQAKVVEAEVEEHSLRPDDIPKDVWNLVQENGRLATERLNEILASPRFPRLRAGDQAKLIALAQNRAYGMPKTNNAAAAANRKRGGASDVTAATLRNLASRAALPEYKRSGKLEDVEDATILPN